MRLGWPFSFAVFGLALVGLPGTLSFCSQDLLIHGTLMSHPVTGVVLPIATAMNAVSLFRLFARLFLGKRRTGFTHMADALPRERWTLAAGMLFVVLGGLFPNLIVAQRSAEADTVALRTDAAMREMPRKTPRGVLVGVKSRAQRHIVGGTITHIDDDHWAHPLRTRRCSPE